METFESKTVDWSLVGQIATCCIGWIPGRVGTGILSAVALLLTFTIVMLFTKEWMALDDEMSIVVASLDMAVHTNPKARYGGSCVAAWQKSTDFSALLVSVSIIVSQELSCCACAEDSTTSIQFSMLAMDNKSRRGD